MSDEASRSQSTNRRHIAYCLWGAQVGLIFMHLGLSGTFSVVTSPWSFGMGYAAGALWMAGGAILWRLHRYTYG